MNVLWEGMPEFKQEKKTEFKKIKVTFIDDSYIFVRFSCKVDYDRYLYRSLKFNFSTVSAQRGLFSNVTEQKITDKTKSIWFPFKSHWGGNKTQVHKRKNSKPFVSCVYSLKGSG